MTNTKDLMLSFLAGAAGYLFFSQIAPRIMTRTANPRKPQ